MPSARSPSYHLSQFRYVVSPKALHITKLRLKTSTVLLLSGLQEMCPFGQKGLRNLHEEIPKGGQLRMRQEGLNEGGKEGVYGMCQVREAKS